MILATLLLNVAPVLGGAFGGSAVGGIIIYYEHQRIKEMKEDIKEIKGDIKQLLKDS